MTDGAANLDDLHWHWGEAYLIHHLGPGTWVAQRRDSRKTLGAEDPETLRERIKARALCSSSILTWAARLPS